MANLDILTALKKKCDLHHARLVAVSKTKPLKEIMEVYSTGHQIFGENKVQELTDKQKELPDDIQWHMIGHLQTNKVKYIAPFVSMIHSVDSYKLAREIDKQAGKADRVIPVLLQVHIAEETSKFGLRFDELEAVLAGGELFDLKNIRLVGLMGMATFTSNMDQVRREFKSLKAFHDKLKRTYFKDHSAFTELSMGMTGDYEIALEEGSTMIRVGSAIFGERNT